jgi:hypothetical protein
VKLDVETLATVPIVPPAAGPDRALEPPPASGPDPGLAATVVVVAATPAAAELLEVAPTIP